MNIKIIYIDDEIDISLSRFLANRYGNSYDEVTFNCEEGYDDLINSEIVKQSNIIIIDSRLFENNSVKDKKFTGEEFKIILRKISPFIEVIVLTQNDNKDDEQTISKFKEKHDGDNAENYYTKTLIPKVENAINNIETFRHIAQKLSSNKNIDKVLIEKINHSLDGLYVYNDLNSDDVDELINAFEELKKILNE